MGNDAAYQSEGWRWPDLNENIIPRQVYSRADLYQREMERIFRGPTWNLVAHESEIAEPYSFKTAYIGEIPIIINRAEDGEPRAFLNSCAHRGTMVETRNRGKARSFQCPYHRWTFDARGRLTGCPGEEDFPDTFRRQDFGLRALRAASYLGLIFITMSQEAPPLMEYLGAAAPVLAECMYGDGRLRLLGYQKALFNCNWKTYTDQEGYHPPLLHAAFRLINWQGGDGEVIATENGHRMIVYSSARYEDNGFLKDPSVVEVRNANHVGLSHVAALFPMGVVTDHLDAINIRFARPIGPDNTEVQYAYFAYQNDSPALANHRVRQVSNLLGPAGLVSFDDAAVFLRMKKAEATEVENTILKGYREGPPPYRWPQNSEADLTVFWNHYRKLMAV